MDPQKTTENSPAGAPVITPDQVGSEQITPAPRGWQQSLPGMSMNARGSDQEPGAVEAGVCAQIAAMHTQGLLTPMHAGLEALAIRAARDVDQSYGIGAPSGRAKLLEVMNSILSELPEVEVKQANALDAVLGAILDGDDDEPGAPA